MLTCSRKRAFIYGLFTVGYVNLEMFVYCIINVYVSRCFYMKLFRLLAAYRDSKTEGHKFSYKLRHPTMQVEASSRVFARYWPLFHIGVNGKVTMGRMVLQRSAR